MQPFFTIATISYQSGEWIRQAIESTLSSTFTDFELLISDDCSKDETWNIIQEYKDPRITAWRNETNIGEYANRNKVLAKARGQYIFYIDGDDILYKDTLALMHKYLQAFPQTGMLWGVPVNAIDFAALPYMFSPSEITKLVYFTHLPLSIIGLAETIFNTAALRDIGGFSTQYAIGDTYLKRKLASIYPVLLVPTGLSFWRRSKDQASQKASVNYRAYIDLYEINKAVINSADFPCTAGEKLQAAKNVRIGELKLLVSMTLLKGRIRDFFKLCSRLQVGFREFGLLWQRGKYEHKPVADISHPLLNDYHFDRK